MDKVTVAIAINEAATRLVAAGWNPLTAMRTATDNMAASLEAVGLELPGDEPDETPGSSDVVSGNDEPLEPHSAPSDLWANGGERHSDREARLEREAREEDFSRYTAEDTVEAGTPVAKPFDGGTLVYKGPPYKEPVTEPVIRDGEIIKADDAPLFTPSDPFFEHKNPTAADIRDAVLAASEEAYGKISDSQDAQIERGHEDDDKGIDVFPGEFGLNARVYCPSKKAYAWVKGTLERTGIDTELIYIVQWNDGTRSNVVESYLRPANADGFEDPR